MTTYTNKYNHFLHLVFLLVLSLFGLRSYAQEQGGSTLLRESIVKGITSNHEVDPYFAKNLLESGYKTRYYSGKPESWDEGAYLEVELKNGGLSENDPNHLLIYVRRVEAGFENAHPTAFQVKGLFEGDDPKNDDSWQELFYVYLLYRGPFTQEYSSKVSIKKLWRDVLNNNEEYDPEKIDLIRERVGKNLTKLRFYVTANNNREYDPDTKYRDMAISRFDVIRLDPAADYSDTFIDRFHLATDYIDTYKDYTFEHTRGIFDEPNQVDGWGKAQFESAKSQIEGTGIKLPDFNLITNATSDITLNEDEKRQPTHTIEHIIYAIPGDVVALYPFYQLWEHSEYCEQFSHWYSYPTGGRLTYTAPWSEREYELLDFAIDPSRILRSDKYGFYGSAQLNGDKLIIDATDNATAVKQYIDAVNRINQQGSGNIKLERDLDFSGIEDVPMLGTEEKPFKGFFNGNGHTISNLKINRPDEDHVGLISWSNEGAHIENLTIDGSCEIKGRNFVGLIGEHKDKILYIKNIRTEATILGEKCGGLVGHSSGNSNRLIVENCYIGGQVGYPDANGNKENAAIAGWSGMEGLPNDNENEWALLKNLIVTANVNGQQESNYYFRTQGGHTQKMRVVECEGIYGAQGFNPKSPEECEANVNSKLGWNDGKPSAPSEQPGVSYVVGGDRVPGTYATFFCPRNPYSPAGAQHNLPYRQMEDHLNTYVDYDDKDNKEKNEFVIAADFSQNFVDVKHISDNEKTIYEPIISMRHLFRIRDGKEFAEEFSGSPENNKEYVRKHQRMVSARAGVPFQIRFDTPVPADITTRSNYYYKIDNTDYRRVCSMDIRVLNALTGEEEEMPFKMAEEFDGQGSRKLLYEGTDTINYELCGGKYYRMLELAEPPQEHYIVQLIGKDVNGNVIKVYDGDGPRNEDLIVMEYNITFLPEEGASLLTESELYSEDNKYAHAREEVMKERYGEPNTSIDFDEYMQLDNLENRDALVSGEKGKSYFKWPMSWDACNYSFGYNQRYDYNMYMLATHASLIPHGNAAKAFNMNAAGDGVGQYDRRYYKTWRLKESGAEQEIEKGYFYYLNAATDPGVAARLKVDNLCMGSTIYVSAWISEFNTHPETANLSFNFVAVMNGEQKGDGYEEGERVLLHSFISGYLPKNPDKDYDGEHDKRSEWRNVYYSFVPRLSEFFTDGVSAADVHHYELELDNNCKSSDGADYAIDDISVYVVRPVIYASQLKPMCDMKSARIKVESPFNSILQTIGQQEKTGNDIGEPIEMYYTFLDKDVYDKTYKNSDATDESGAAAEAFEAAVVQFAYNGGNEGSSKYGKITFKANYTKNPEYTENPDNLNEAMQEIASDGERMIVFFSDLEDDSFYSGKEYYVVLKTPLASEDAPSEGTEWVFFDMETECAKKNTFSIIPSNLVKVDGTVVDDFSNVRVCEGQSPVIQINVQGQNENGEYELVERNAWFDWFNGSMEEFNAFKDNDIENEDNDLATALATFRTYYPEEGSVEGIEPTDNLKEWMLHLLAKATAPGENGAEAKLLLRQSSYVFPPLRFDEGAKETVYRVVAIPIPVEVENLVVCTAPSELRIRVEGRAPELAHGLGSMPYPDDMKDVPLRIGIDQIRDINNGKKEMKTVEIPVRRVAATGFSEGITDMTLKTDDDNKTMIILVQTNDPEYKDLGTIGEEGEEIGALLEVGEVKALTAKINGKENLFKVIFDEDFNFKEGYYYRFRFNYEEATNETTQEGKTVCDGQDVFTLKIVPRYLQWTGKLGLNWNNDANWSRINGADMRNEEADGKKDYLLDAKTEGKLVNGNSSAYAPLDFTSVIIPYGVEAPWLYAPATSKVDGFDWPAKPSEIPAAKEYADKPEDAGEATDNIQYDMAAYYKNNVETVYCRPWYANTCYDIHFNAGSAIMNQHELAYARAWADVELNPTRWYLLSTPFQEVYAGDFYLPSKNARQETEYFKEISYDEKLNNRFRPAVYQRGWDKGSATVYEIDKTEGRNVALQTTWSHVYNDVNEGYGQGVGFSIKTDVSALGDDFNGDKVMFRLPKDDEKYKYYDLEGKSNSAHDKDIVRTEAHYRLNEFNEDGNTSVTISGASAGKIFLAGNPMMARLDIKSFLEANNDVIKNHLWIITENGQEVVLADENNNSGDNSVITLAPFQGFFVEAKEPIEQSLTLTYNTSMMRRHKYDENGDAAEGLTRSTAAPLKITAFVDGNRSSSAVISPEGDGSGVMALDNRELGIKSIVYSVNGESAMSINYAPLDGREIGVIADGDTETLLRFENTAMAEGLYLYDNAEGTLTPIEEGTEYEVKGEAAGRLFITSGLEEIAIPSSISWKVEGEIVSVMDGSSTGWLGVNVFDTLGRLVKKAESSDNSVSFQLGNGVYLMEIQTAGETKKVKFVI